MIRVVDPPALLVALDRVKAHLRVDGDEENDLIAIYIAAAQATIDGPPGWLGRALGVQTLEYRTYLPDRGGCAIMLPCPPVVEVTGVSIVDDEDRETAIDPSAWRLTGDAELQLHAALGVTGSARRPDALRIRYQAGYKPGNNEDFLWPPLLASVPAAMLVMISMLYEQRSGAADLQNNPTVNALLGPLRVWG